MTGTEKHLEELEQQEEIRKTLEKNLSQVKSLPWEQIDNVDSAEIPKALD